MKKQALRFRDVPIGRMFQFPEHPSSQFRGTYRKVSARKFTDGIKEYRCAASAVIRHIES